MILGVQILFEGSAVNQFLFCISFCVICCYYVFQCLEHNVIFQGFIIKFYRYFLFKSLNNWSSTFFVLVQIKNISLMYLKYVNDFPSINEYMCFHSKYSMNIFAQVVPIATLVCRKFLELNIKLFKVRMRAKKVVIIFVAIAFFVKFSWDIFIAFIPSELGMLA